MLEPHFDVRVLTFTVAVAALTGLLFSIVPALQATRVDAAKPDDTNRTSTAKPRARLGQALVVVQVTLSLVLLSGAALFIRTLQNLNSVEAGFSRHGVMTMRVEAPLPPFDAARNAVMEHAQLAHMWQALLDRLSVLPAVTSVGFSTMSPLSRRDRGVLIDVPGEPQKTERDRSIHLNHVTPGYFDTFGIRLIEGRRFTPAGSTELLPGGDPQQDRRAPLLWTGQPDRPYGRLFPVSGSRILIRSSASSRTRGTTVCVASPSAWPICRSHSPSIGLAASSSASARRSSQPVFSPACATRRRGSVPGSAVTNVITLEQQIDDSMLQERLVAMLASVFGGLALVLACIGVYGVLSYAVLRRTREIGIRLAIGARRGSVIWLVVRETVLLIVMALAIGIPTVLLTTRYVKAQLYGVTPGDPLAISLAIIVLVGVAALAALVPARRASNVDPMIALRWE